MRTVTHRRVVVTGMGGVSNLGPTAITTWSAMKSGRSGISPLRFAGGHGGVASYPELAAKVRAAQ